MPIPVNSLSLKKRREHIPNAVVVKIRSQNHAKGFFCNKRHHIWVRVISVGILLRGKTTWTTTNLKIQLMLRNKRGEVVKAQLILTISKLRKMKTRITMETMKWAALLNKDRWLRTLLVVLQDTQQTTVEVKVNQEESNNQRQRTK